MPLGKQPGWILQQTHCQGKQRDGEGTCRFKENKKDMSTIAVYGPYLDPDSNFFKSLFLTFIRPLGICPLTGYLLTLGNYY